MTIKNRQLEILLYLIEVKKTTYTELVQRFEVSKRTIMRDIDALSTMGVPVYSQAGYQGGIFIPTEYKFSKSFFAPQEIEDLVLALHITEKLRKQENKSSVLKKLELLVPELTFLRENDFYEYMKVELLQDPIVVDTPVCRAINYALDEEVFLKITVCENTYIVAPLYYVLRPKGLFLHCSDGDNYFTFPILDITECEPTETSFQREKFKTE